GDCFSTTSASALVRRTTAFDDFLAAFSSSSRSASLKSEAGSSLELLADTSTTNGGSINLSICLKLESILRDCGVGGHPQLIWRSAPCASVKRTPHRLCSSSKYAPRFLSCSPLTSLFKSFSSFSIFLGGFFLSPSKSARWARPRRGSSAVIFSLRKRLSTLS